MAELLQEFVDSRGVTMRVDRSLGVLRGVKLIGLESRNGRRYRESALEQAKSLYEESKVNVNHPKDGPLAPRDYQDRLGVIRGVEFRSGEGLFGDLHFNPKHPLAEQLAWDAEHNPRNVGFSHNVLARLSREGEMTVVDGEGIDRKILEKAKMRLGEGVAGELAEKKRVVIVREAGNDGPAAGREYNRRSYMIVPLVHDSEVIGVLCVTERYHDGPFDENDQAYMEAFSEMAGQIAYNCLQYRAADELATIDEGTQLFNRRHFNRVFPQEVIRAKRYKHDLTLALIDVDYFKLYNDSNGHQAGDRALAIVSRVLKESFREADIVVRYGGEEFAVIMPETSRAEGNGVGFVDRARSMVEEAGLMFEDAQGNARTLTVSGGVATLPQQADSWEDLFEKADQALYRAKESGRNRIVGY